MANFFSKGTGDSTKNVSSVLIIFIVCVAAFIGGFFVTHLLNGVSRFAVEQKTIIKNETPPQELEEVKNEIKEEPLQENENDANALAIEWIQSSQQPVAEYEPVLAKASCFNSEYICENNLSQYFSVVQLGVVKGGVYDGRSLEMATSKEEGMGTNYASYYLLRDPEGQSPLVLLNRHYRRTVDWLPTDEDAITATEVLGERISQLDGYVIENDAYIPELLTIEKKLIDTQDRSFLFTGLWVRLYSNEAISLTSAEPGATLSDGTVLYLYEPKEDTEGNLLPGQTNVGRDQFYLVDEDGRVLWYDFSPSFFKYDTDDEGHILESRGVPQIQWNDGSLNILVYFKGQVGGCGFTKATNVVSDDNIEKLSFSKVGIATGEDGIETPIFEPLNYQNEYYTNAFNNVTFSNEEPKTYADFEHPYFYYQDAFDRWVEAMSIEMIPPVECGKPVIYLYPEQTTSLSVWVNPKGGFSYTEPEYDDGWRVTAYPDGNLLNQDDGLEYPYLFWEGRGGTYSAPEHYWVIERSKVENFLRETLEKMGLIENEINDFVEFWLPRMQEAPYYKIGFHGTTVMDQLAPLQFSVRPDHIFRLLMDYSPLENRVPSNPLTELPHANREGFDVMEWGGVLQ